MIEIVVFATFAVLALGSAIVVITHPDPVKSTMSLVLTFFSVAVLYVLLHAPFIATLQVLVYTGAILVLFLFVLMLLNISRETHREDKATAQTWLTLLGAGFFFGLLALYFYRSTSGIEPVDDLGGIHDLSVLLFSRYLITFEMIGLLLLAAVVGASFLTSRLEEKNS